MTPIFKTPVDGHFFFGYYDKSPLSGDNRRLLAQRVSFIERLPTETDTLEIGLFDRQRPTSFLKIAETTAWNFQQGCMLQWLGPDFNGRIIYNDRRNGRFVAIVRDVAKGCEKELSMAVYAVHPEGHTALCINNERHYWFRPGYNYQGVANRQQSKPIDVEDGIWSLNVVTGRTSRIVSMADLLATKRLSTMRDGAHYIEHLMFSPSGHRFLFLHRWQLSDGGIYTRLYSANADGSDLVLLNDSGRMSHFCWRGNEEIIGYGAMVNTLNRIRQHRMLVKYLARPLLPMYHMFFRKDGTVGKATTGDSYLLFKDRSGPIGRLFPERLLEDGHPSCHPGDRNILLSDSYTQGDGKRELFTVDLRSGVKTSIARLSDVSSSTDTGYRCDLHPKWSRDGTFICVDTLNDGVRSMYVYPFYS